MKPSVAELSLIVLSLGFLGATQIIDPNQKVICSPENPKDCYPRIFVPTTEWQIIRENQDIPPGLHVRLNIETLEREAKLMDPEDQDISNAVILSDEQVKDPSDEGEMELNDSQRDEIRKKVAEFKKLKNDKPKTSVEDLNSFQNAIEEVVNYGGDKSRLKIALETIEELSHDIEFGVNLTQDTRVFTSFLALISSDVGEDLEEIIYRIMGSSLRNNPEAIKNTIEGQSKGLVDELFERLGSSSSDIIQKRILGIIQSLNQDRYFKSYFFNNHGVLKLVKFYTVLGPQAKERMINIFEDIQMITESQSTEKRSDRSIDSDWQYSQMLQEILAGNKYENKEQLKLFFSKLVEVHENKKDLDVSRKFLQWLSKEVSSNSIEERDDTPENLQFREDMLHARHVVFGNPHALRKALADEL